MTDHAVDLPTTSEICQIALESLLEILGPEDLNEILPGSSLPVVMDDENINVTADIGQISWIQLHQTLLTQFGKSGTAGIAIRTGQVLFKNFYREFGSATFLDDRDYRMLPKPVRIRKGLEGLALLQEKYISGSQATIEYDEENWYWKLYPMTEEEKPVQNQDLLAKIIWGMVIEFLSWTAGGKVYPVHETSWEEPAIKERVIVIKRKYIS